jgi:diguanylate cyclase (GGDEF)-like protein
MHIAIKDLWIYIDMPLICILISLYIFLDITFTRDERPDLLTIRRASVLAALYILADALLSMIALGFIPFNFGATYALNIFYNGICCIFACTWVSYIQLFTGDRKGKIVKLASIGIFAATAVAALALSGSDLFIQSASSDGARSFAYGKLDFIWFFSEIPAMAYVLVRALLYGRKDEHLLVREKIIPIIIYAAVHITVCLLQMIDLSMPIIGFAIALFPAYIYFSALRFDVSKDELTGLDNRRQLYRDVNQALRGSGPDKIGCLIMLDLDRFKAINDGFGHTEGDAALKSLADILREACEALGGKAYRYGGDEFIIQRVLKKNEDIGENEYFANITSHIRRALGFYNRDSGKLYKLSATFGHTTFGQDSKNTSISDVINRADEILYEGKRGRPESQSR